MKNHQKENKNSKPILNSENSNSSKRQLEVPQNQEKSSNKKLKETFQVNEASKEKFNLLIEHIKNTKNDTQYRENEDGEPEQQEDLTNQENALLLISKMKKAELLLADNDGKTALHWAAGVGNLTIIKGLLMKQPALSTIEDGDENTADKTFYYSTGRELVLTSNIFNDTNSNKWPDFSFSEKAFSNNNNNNNNDEDNHTNKALSLREEESYWYSYTKSAMGQLLQLRLNHEKLIEAAPLILKNIFEGDEKSADLIVQEINTQFNEGCAGPLLVPINLYNKHWAGLVVEKAANSQQITVSYIDPEQQPIPMNLKIAIDKGLDSLNYPPIIQKVILEPQKYNNCGPEVIENMIEYLTGERFSQEEAPQVHSMLLEELLLGEGTSSY